MPEKLLRGSANCLLAFKVGEIADEDEPEPEGGRVNVLREGFQ